MDAILEKIALQIPDLAALIFLVVIFLKQMGKRDSMIEKIVDENMDARTHSRETIEACTKVMGEVVKVMEKCTMQGNHRR